jgi:hypothetical protein
MLLVTLAALAAVPPSGLAFGPHYLVADGDGTVRAWTTKELRFDAAFTKKLNGDGLLGIALDDGTLWGFDGTRAFTWDGVSARWDLVPSKPPPKPCTHFAVVADAPVGLCGPGVHRFTDGRYFEGPEFKDQVSGRGFGDHPHVAAHGSVLAIGTGFGEWGGHLWLLDVSDGSWRKHYDSLGNAVGVTWTGSAWVVAWSMSHMMAHTRARLHGADARPTTQGKELRDRYLRALAWDDEAKALFGLEQNELVRFDASLAFKKVQSIAPVKYGPERDAVGVSSGISAFVAVGSGKFLVVPESGEPVVVGGGKSERLRAPAVGAGDAGAR